MSRSRMARTSRSAESVDEQPERQRRPDAIRGEQPLKHALLVLRRESEEEPSVLAHDEMRLQLHLLAHARQRLVHAERDRELVGDAAAREDLDAIELLGDELAGDAGDQWITLAVCRAQSVSAEHEAATFDGTDSNGH